MYLISTHDEVDFRPTRKIHFCTATNGDPRSQDRFQVVGPPNPKSSDKEVINSHVSKINEEKSSRTSSKKRFRNLQVRTATLETKKFKERDARFRNWRTSSKNIQERTSPRFTFRRRPKSIYKETRLGKDSPFPSKVSSTANEKEPRGKTFC